MEEKMTRMRRRANDEISVVTRNIDELEQTVDRLGSEIAQMVTENAVLEERILASKDHDQKLKMVREIKRNNQRIYYKNLSNQNFNDIIDSLDTLLSVIEAFYDRKCYAKIVRIIPEKKLDRIVQDNNKYQKVLDLIVKTLDKFERAMTRYGIMSDNFTNRIKDVKTLASKTREIARTESEDEYLLSQIEAKKTQETAAEGQVRSDYVPEANRNFIKK